MESWERVKYIMDNEGLNKNSFSSAIGSSNNVTITRIINEQRKPSRSTCEKIVNAFPKYSLNWLLTGEGDMLTQKEETAQSCSTAVNQEFKNLIDRIKYEFSINQSQIAERLGIKQTYLSDMINGRVPYNESMRNKINDVFHIHGYENNSYIKKEKSVNQENVVEITSTDIKENIFTGTPVYDIDATCGTDNREIEFAEDRIIGSVDLPEVSKAGKIITANGDSMEPVIRNGSRIVIRQVFGWEDIFYGQIYLILLDEYRMIKYIRRYEPDEENYIILRSENSKYDDIKLHKSKIRKLFIVENILSVKTQI